MVESIKLPAKIEHVESFMHFVRDYARDEGFSSQRIDKIELAIEEALVNICRYAYSEVKGDMEMICRTDTDKRLIIDIVDAGEPFNVLMVSEPDLAADIEDREIGGLGVLFIRKMVDDIQYRRRNNKNILTLILRHR